MSSNQRRAAVLAIATALAIPAEGLRRTWYRDPAMIATVCYGHTGKDIDKSKVYSLDECKALLSKDMNNAVSTVDSCRPGLPIPVLAAFSDLAYNVGPHAACDSSKSTAARLLAAGKYREACDQLQRWVYASVGGVQVALPGLVKRRAMERDVCLSGVQ